MAEPDRSSPTWGRDVPPPEVPLRLGLGTSLRILLRGGALACVTFGGLALHTLVRLVERPLYGERRPWTSQITMAVCRLALKILGLAHRVEGNPLTGTCAVVANHGSWLDIFALNARQPVTFVSKAEVAGWPGIGWLARATGTLFIRRSRADASAQTALIAERLGAGQILLFFPEGTSTDGRRVLPFNPTLFQAFFAAGFREGLKVQPVTVYYRAPAGLDPRFYGWWGGMDFGGHLLRVLAMSRNGSVEVTYHPPLRVADHADRKALARSTHRAVADHHARRIEEEAAED